MTLSFSTKWGKEMGELAGMPTYFVEKIWRSFTDDILKADIHVAAKRLNIAGGNRVEPALLPKLRQFIRDLEEYLRGEPKPKWLEVLENKYSLKPYKSITTNH